MRTVRRVLAGKFGRRTMITALAVVACGASTTSAFGADPAPSKPGAPVTTVRELTSLRTANSDTFLQSDGTRAQKIYSHAVNYRVGDAWQPIEDQLTQANDGTWHPTASPMPVSLPASLGSGPVTVGPSSQQFGFSLEGASSNEGTPAGAKRTYADALPGVTVSYLARPGSVRETLSLASASAPTLYRYKLSLSSGLHASLAQSGRVQISNESGKVIYWLAAPTATDSSAIRHLPSRAPVHYELSSDGSILSLVIDHAWLTDSSRVFPVKIDPEAWFTEPEDCSIVSQAHAEWQECGGFLSVGADAESPKNISRTLLHFDLSSVPKDSTILSSRLALWFLWTGAGESTQNIQAYALKDDGFTSEVTWNKFNGTTPWTTPGGDYLPTPSGEQTVKPSQAYEYIEWGIAPQVEQWVRDPTSNHGILLKSHEETLSTFDTFEATDGPEGEPEPYIEVIYEPHLGVPPGQPVFQEAIGNGGTLSVNAANGNLNVQDPDVNYATEGYDTQITRSYNSQDDLLTGKSFHDWGIGLGEDTNLYQASYDGSAAVVQPDGSDVRFDRAPWADGHPSAGDKAFTGAEANVPETLIEHSGGTRTLTHNDTGVEWKYDNDGFPEEIVDPGGEGNTISMSYTYELLTGVSDTHGHSLTVARDPETTWVSKIAGAGGEKWKYTYDSFGRLKTYKGPEGQEATYGYRNEDDKLTKIVDPTGTIVISYDEHERVSSLRKLVNGTVSTIGSEDEITSFSYEEEQTTVTNPEGGKATYYYDQFGNALEEPATQEAAVEAYAGDAGIETEAARKDVDLQDHASILDSQLAQQLGEAYTGEWFDPTSEKPLKLGITEAGYERTVEQDLDNLGLADNADILTESTGTEELLAEGDSLEAALSELAHAGIVRIGVRERSDSTLIEEASTISPSQKATVTSAVASAKTPVTIEKRTLASLSVTEDSCSETTCTPPLRGGVSIQTEYGTEKETGFCTAGFLAQSDYGPVHYLLTAGHCIAETSGVGGKWTTAGTEIGSALGYVDGSSHHLPGGGTTEDRGDEGLLYVNPEGEYGKHFEPWVIVYGNSGFKTARNETYAIRGTHFAPKITRQEQFMVCAGGAPTIGEETGTEGLGEMTNVKPYQAERCGMTDGFRNIAEYGVKHVEEFKECDASNLEGFRKGASGSPVYKNGWAFGIYVYGSTEGEGCEGFYEGINTIEGVFDVHVLRTG
jgi:hypothetical protein